MKPHSKYLLGLDSFCSTLFLLDSFTLLCVGAVSTFPLPDHVPLYEWFVAEVTSESPPLFSLGYLFFPENIRTTVPSLPSSRVWTWVLAWLIGSAHV